MSLALLGVDFRHAALDLRAALSYDVAATRSLLARVGEIPGLREAAVLSTCNRTEFYLVIDDGSDAATRWLHALRRDCAHARVTDPACLLVRHEGEARPRTCSALRQPRPPRSWSSGCRMPIS